MTAGLYLDFASGAFFLALAGFVGFKRPRTRAGLWFAAFAGTLGVRTLIDNAVRLEWLPWEFFGTAHYLLFILTAFGLVVTAIGMVHAIDRIRAPWLLLLAPVVFGFAVIAYRANDYTWMSTFAVSSTSVYNLSLLWLIGQLIYTRLHNLTWALIPYATAYTLITVANTLPLTSGAAVALWLSQWGVSTAALLFVFVRLAFFGYRGQSIMLLVVAIVSMAVSIFGGDPPEDLGLMGLLRVIAVASVGYSIVQERAFGIDVKLKIAIKQSTIITVFFAMFTGIQSLVGEFFTEKSLIGGGVATAVMVLAFSPLQRVAERLSKAAMPGAVPPGERSLKERTEMYRKLSIAAWDDGVITQKEVRLLEAARTQLNLDMAVTAKVDLDVRG